MKLLIVGAIQAGCSCGFTLNQACEVIQLSPRRLRRWVAGKRLEEITEADLTDRAPIAKTHPHALTSDERGKIVAAARDLVSSSAARCLLGQDRGQGLRSARARRAAGGSLGEVARRRGVASSG